MWQRYNPTTHVFEQSSNNGGSWTVMPLDYSSIVNPPANIAYTNNVNNFSVDQIIKTGWYPSLVLWNTALGTDKKKFWVRYANDETLVVQAINDADNTVLAIPLTLDRAGNAIVGSNLRVTNKLSVGTSVLPAVDGDVVIARAAHTLSGTIYFGTSLGGYFYRDTAGTYSLVGGALVVAANIQNSAGYLYPGRADSGGAQQNSWYLASHGSYGLYTNTSLYLVGNVYVDTIFVRGSINELGRSASMGYWIAYTPTLTASAGTWTASTISAAYTLIGNTCIVRITAENGTTSAANAWIAASLPYAPAGYHQVGAGRIYFPGYGAQGVMCQGNSGDPRMIWSRDVDKGNIAAYTGGGLHVYGFLAYQIG